MLKMFVYYILFLSSLLHIVTSLPPKGETFKWTAKPWPKAFPQAPPMMPRFKNVDLYDRFTISCKTNDPDATVTLNHQTNSRSKYTNVVTKSPGRIVPIRQTFLVTSAKMSDSGDITCMAVDKKGTQLKKLKKGTIIVKSVVKADPPEIIPSTRELIESNGDGIIQCKTKGLGLKSKSLLSWYRKLKNGQKVKVDASRIESVKQGRTDSTTIDVEKLIFKNFSSADVGEYICDRKVSGIVTSTSVMVELKPDVPPTVTVDVSTTTPRENSPLSLVCSAKGSPKPRLTWKINGKENKTCAPTRSKLDDSKCIYTIDNVKLEDHNGDFSCTAKNLAGEGSKSVKIEVQVPPSLRKVYIKSVVALSNEAVELFCEVLRANPLPTITWYEQKCNATGTCDVKESLWKPVAQQQPVNSTKTERSFIVTPKVDVPYWYRYIARNPSGSYSFDFKLTRNDNHGQQFAIVSKEAKDGVLEVYEEEEISFKCLVDSTVYKSQNLKKGGANLPTTRTKEGETTVLKYTETKAQLTDAGTYTCEAVSKSDISRTRTIEVKVKKLIAPSITGFKNEKIVQDENRDYVISCDASGSPPPKVSWKFNGNAIPSTKKIDNKDKCVQLTPGTYVLPGNKLVVCKVDFTKHNGTYQCIASNRLSNKNATMDLQIESSPIIIDWQESYPIGVSDPADLICRTKANPPANVTWYKIGENKVHVYQQTNMVESFLTLSDVMENAAYVCKVENVHGNTSDVCSVVVAGKVVEIKGGNKNVIIGVVVAGVILLVLAVILMCWYKRRLEEKYALYLAPNDTFEFDPDKSLFEQSNDLPYDMAWEFPRNRLVFIKTLGSGAFGEVWLAEASGIHAFEPRDTSAAATKRRKSMQKSKRYHTVTIRYKKQQEQGEIDLEKTMVAVKKLKKDASTDDYKDLASELKIIIHLGANKNIVNLLGACTVGGDLNVILECCPHGNLLSFLRARREIFKPEWFKKETDMEKELTYIDLVMICHQAAKGMEFLQARKCVHRDLAARNVLVGNDFIMKIGDFGLARDIANDDLYLKQTTGLLPVKWMAPESLFDKIYTSMSDVWSFGILLWEVFTLGGSPYPGLPTEDLFAFLEDGKRMDRPDACPVEMYEIMMDCWVRSPYGRPMFGQLEERIGNCMGQNVHNDSDYLDYRDAVPQEPTDNYLMANDDSRNAPDDYLLANDMSNGICNDPLYVPPEDKFSKFSPKGQTYVPPVAGSISDDDDHQYDACDFSDNPRGRKDSYEKMTPQVDYPPDDDYLNPSDTTYLNPVDTHPTVV